MASEAELLALADDLDNTVIAFANNALEADNWPYQVDSMAFASNAANVARYVRARAATMGGSDD